MEEWGTTITTITTILPFPTMHRGKYRDVCKGYSQALRLLGETVTRALAAHVLQWDAVVARKPIGP